MFSDTTYMNSREYKSYKLAEEFAYKLNEVKLHRAKADTTKELYIKILEELSDIKATLANNDQKCL